MAQFELDIPLKKRADVVDALNRRGLQAEIRRAREATGDRCVLIISNAVMNVQQAIEDVLRDLRIDRSDAA